MSEGAVVIGRGGLGHGNLGHQTELWCEFGLWYRLPLYFWAWMRLHRKRWDSDGTRDLVKELRNPK